mgnify:CR=1 FL=1
MKSYTIDSVCTTLRSLAPHNAPAKIQADMAMAIDLIKAGSPEAALFNLVQARCDSALADEDNRPLVAAVEEVASWMIYKAKSLVQLSDVVECLSLWAHKGKLADAIKERERSLKAMAA